VNSGQASWFDVAHEAARRLGVPPRCRAASVRDVTFKAPRPRYCALANHKLAAAGFPMPTWQDALGRWLAMRSDKIGVP
jgi:dTDP-4-dehydrorhamnose reductase